MSDTKSTEITTQPQTYCQFVKSLPEDDLHRVYHDKHYGFPLNDDEALFERLVWEINQAGLSWTTILKKQHGFRQAFFDFSIPLIAAACETDKQRWMSNTEIIRNARKIDAVVYNAQQVLRLQQEHGSWGQWLEQQRGQSLLEWVKRFKHEFHFVGGEIVREFLVSTGYLPGAHDDNCLIAQRIVDYVKSA